MKAANYDVDLTNCDREPIHQLGAIQPFGALVAFNADWFVSHYSANFTEITGIDTPIELGMALKDIVPNNAMRRLRSLASTISHVDQVERMFGFALFGNGKKYDCAVHCSGDYTILEIEPHLEGELDRQLAALRPVLGRFDKFRDAPALVGEDRKSTRLNSSHNA